MFFLNLLILTFLIPLALFFFYFPTFKFKIHETFSNIDTMLLSNNNHNSNNIISVFARVGLTFQPANL